MSRLRFHFINDWHYWPNESGWFFTLFNIAGGRTSLAEINGVTIVILGFGARISLEVKR